MPRFVVTVQLEIEAADAWEARELVGNDVCDVYERAAIQDVSPGVLPEPAA